MSEASREDAFLATYIGCKPVVSRGGHVFSFVVPFEDSDHANAVCGGAWKPDDLMTMAITRVGRIAKKA